MWHGTFPWIYSHSDDEWWYMHSGNDGKFYAFRNGDQEWYVYSEGISDWVLANKTTNQLKEEGESQLKDAKFDEALATFQKALSVSISKYGENDRRVADAHEWIGNALMEKGDFEESLESHENALDIRSNKLGSDDVAVADSYAEIGNLKGYLGKYDEALAYAEKSLNIRLSKLDQSDPQIASAYNLKGEVEYYLGDMVNAKESFQNALGKQLSSVENDDSILASTYGGLAGVLWHFGDFERALEYNLEALRLTEETFGLDHPILGEVKRNLVYNYEATGHYDKILETAQEAFNITYNSLGENHPSSIEAYRNIADAYYFLGEQEKAHNNYAKAQGIAKATLGENHPTTGELYSRLSKENEEYADKAVDILTSTLGPNHTSTMNAELSLLLSEGAAENNLFALDNLIKKFEEVNEDALHNLNDLYSSMGSFYDRVDSGKAIEYHQKALSNASLILPNNHPRLAYYYSGLGYYYTGKNEFDEAHEYLDKAIGILEDNSLEQSGLAIHPNLIKGIAYMVNQQYFESLEYIKKYHDIFTSIYSADSLKMGITHFYLGRAYSDIGDEKQALFYLEKALPIYQANYEENDPSLDNLRTWIEFNENRVTGSHYPGYSFPTEPNNGHAEHYTFAEDDRPKVVALRDAEGLSANRVYELHAYNVNTGEGRMHTKKGTLIGWVSGRGENWEVVALW